MEETKNSIIPIIKECERFILFMDKKFSLNLPQNYLITINKASKNTIGYFMPKEHEEHFTNTTQDLNNINLNTLYLKTSSPYECLAHELAHFVNNINKIKDCSSNQYHNKHFKTQAEKFFLVVEKGKRGFAYTSESEEFKKMMEEFKPNTEVFNIFQNEKEKTPTKSRLRLYMCPCGVKVRVGSDDFNAVCLNCSGAFIVV